MNNLALARRGAAFPLPLALLTLAIALAFGSCAQDLALPCGKASLLDALEPESFGSPFIAIQYSIANPGPFEIESSGVSFSFETESPTGGSRTYRFTDIRETAIPTGGIVYLSTSFEFRTEGESLVAGSARIIAEFYE